MFKLSKVKKLKSHSASKYFLVGISAFTTDYLVLIILYYLLNVPLKLATSAGFLTGFLISFSINRQWVFGSKKHKKKIWRQIIEYSLLVAFNFLFTVVAVSFLNDHGMKPFIGKLVVMAAIMCWNYVFFRWVIFAAANEPA
jgi:putative flippase GtrA